MQLEIISSSPIVDYKFGNWLILNHIKPSLLNELRSHKLNTWDLYFNEQFETLYSAKLNSQNIVRLGIENLRCYVASNFIYIRINPNVFVPGLRRVKIESLCKLINYGNATIPAIPIFSKIFNQIAEDIDTYVTLYSTQEM